MFPLTNFLNKVRNENVFIKKKSVLIKIVVLMLIVLFYNSIFMVFENVYDYLKAHNEHNKNKFVTWYSFAPVKVIGKEIINSQFLITIYIINDNTELENKTIIVNDQELWESILINKTYSIDFREPKGEQPYLTNIKLYPNITFEEFYKQHTRHQER